MEASVIQQLIVKGSGNLDSDVVAAYNRLHSTLSEVGVNTVLIYRGVPFAMTIEGVIVLIHIKKHNTSLGGISFTDTVNMVSDKQTIDFINKFEKHFKAVHREIEL